MTDFGGDCDRNTSEYYLLREAADIVEFFVHVMGILEMLLTQEKLEEGVVIPVKWRQSFRFCKTNTCGMKGTLMKPLLLVNLKHKCIRKQH